MKTRGKFKLHAKTQYVGIPDAAEYTFYAVCQDGTPENDRFHKYTPSGKIVIIVDNPNVSFELGKEYYVDFTAVE